MVFLKMPQEAKEPRNTSKRIFFIGVKTADRKMVEM